MFFKNFLDSFPGLLLFVVFFVCQLQLTLETARESTMSSEQLPTILPFLGFSCSVGFAAFKLGTGDTYSPVQSVKIHLDVFHP